MSVQHVVMTAAYEQRQLQAFYDVIMAMSMEEQPVNPEFVVRSTKFNGIEITRLWDGFMFESGGLLCSRLYKGNGIIWNLTGYHGFKGLRDAVLSGRTRIYD